MPIFPLAPEAGEGGVMSRYATFMSRGQGGLSLIELLLFIVVVSVGLAGVMVTYRVTVKASADPMVRKQALAVAEALLTEIEQQPFTYCDPNDPNVGTAQSTAGCTGGAAASEDQNGAALAGPMPATETRYSSTTPFNNVADYGGFSMSPIYSVDDAATPIPGLTGYTASVAITRAGITFGLPSDAVLRIAVRVVKQPADITLVGYRFRYAPIM
ncbi:MAG: type II secretion system protein [Rhodocyclaceae bacterium]|nr:type II secretion system protein [Rhodocyclaceae bacterium]